MATFWVQHHLKRYKPNYNNPSILEQPLINSTMKKSLLMLSIIFLSGVYLNAQDIYYHWSDALNGPGVATNDDISRDASGNVYIVGRLSGTVDFDPGTGTANETSMGDNDLFFAKYDQDGNFIWVKQIDMNFPGWGVYPCKIKVKNGSIHIIGTYYGGADFDPGAGVATMTAWGNLAPYVAKYDLNGNYIWSKTMGSANNDHATDIDVDNTGNLYISFVSGGVSVDFDPGAGVASVPVNVNDGVFAKFDPSGNLLFAKSISSVSGGWHPIQNITIDDAQNIYISGYTDGTSDVDPGAAVINVTSSGAPFSYVAKYDATGNYVWHGTYNGGYTTEMRVNLGTNRLYVTGIFNSGTFDTDLTAGTNNLSCNGGYDGFFARYDLNGNHQWSYRMGGTLDDYFQDMDFYRGSQIVTTSNIKSAGIDIDPSGAVTSYSSNGMYDLVLARHGVNGELYRSISIGATNDDVSYAISTNYIAQKINVVGTFNLTVDFDGLTPVQNETAVGMDGYVASYEPYNPTAIQGYYSNGAPIGAGSFRPICVGDSVILSLDPDDGATVFWYDDLGNLVATGDSIVLGPLTTTTTYTAVDSIVGATSEDYWGYTYTYTVPVTEVIVNLTTSDDTVCFGNSVDLTATGQLNGGCICVDSIAYSWNPALGTDTFYTVTPTVNTTYTVYAQTTGSTYFCIDSASVDIVVLPPPTVTIVASDTLLCNGSSVTLTASGATSYSWSGGITNGVPFSFSGTNTYTVVGSNGGLCNDTAQITISSLPGPTVNITATDTLLCGGGNITLTATGATNYTWNGGVTNGVSFAIASTNTFTVIGDDGGLCTDTAQVTITVLTPPNVSINASDTLLCGNGMVTLTASGATTYNWSGGITNGTPFNISTTNTYTVIGSNGGTCNDTAQITISVGQPPVINLYSDTSLCGLTNILIIPIVSGQAPFSYLWSDGSNAGSYNAVDVGVISLTVTDSMGCSATDSVEVTLNCPSELFIPNSFTPNGDGSNDMFLPVGRNVSNFQMEIFTRWGESIFTSNDLAKGWAGDKKGTAAPIGSYTYKISYTPTGDNTKKEIIGHVTLIR